MVRGSSPLSPTLNKNSWYSRLFLYYLLTIKYFPPAPDVERGELLRGRYPSGQSLKGSPDDALPCESRGKTVGHHVDANAVEAFFTESGLPFPANPAAFVHHEEGLVQGAVDRAERADPFVETTLAEDENRPGGAHIGEKLDEFTDFDSREELNP